MPSFKSLNNSQRLIIMSFIMSFYRKHLFREKSYWIPLENFKYLIDIRFVTHLTYEAYFKSQVT